MKDDLLQWQKKYPDKFVSDQDIFSKIRRGDRIFVSTACGEPEYLVKGLTNYAEEHPKAFADTEVFHIWTLGVAPYTDKKFDYNFRHNSFFISTNSREAVNKGLADFTPIFLSEVPQLIYNGIIKFDVSLIHTSLPDHNGYVSLGISVDICKAAIEGSHLVIAQVNPNMPRVHGDTFIHINDINYLVYRDDPLLEFIQNVPGELAQQIGKHVAKIVQDGDTIQIGYGSLPNAILNNLKDKKNIGVHSELLTDSMVDLIKAGVIDNSRKNINKGKVVASFCMGTKPTYEFINDNPIIEFKTIDYTNDPIVISSIHNMTAINSALQIDLTGQATAESIGSLFYSGIGGSADFMRGSVRAPGGKTVLVVQSTAKNGEVSRIVPFLEEGAGVTLNRGDIRYVVTEFGIAYIHGKNIRERAMDLISIAHPKFRSWLLDEAKKHNLIYKDQAYIPGKKGEYPEHLETYRTTFKGFGMHIRPVRMNDESIVKEFFYALSDQSLFRRFMSQRKDVTHEMRQNFVVIDYTKELILLASIMNSQKEIVVGMGQIARESDSLTAEVAFAVRDDYQNNGIGTELLSYLTTYARREGFHGFTAEVLVENKPMLHVFEKMHSDITKTIDSGSYHLAIRFGVKDGKE